MIDGQPKKGIKAWVPVGDAACPGIFSRVVGDYQLAAFERGAKQRLEVCKFQATVNVVVIECAGFVAPGDIVMA